MIMIEWKKKKKKQRSIAHKMNQKFVWRHNFDMFWFVKLFRKIWKLKSQMQLYVCVKWLKQNESTKEYEN